MTFVEGTGITPQLTVGGLSDHESGVRDQFLDWTEHTVTRLAWKQCLSPSLWSSISTSVTELLLENGGGTFGE